MTLQKLIAILIICIVLGGGYYVMWTINEMLPLFTIGFAIVGIAFAWALTVLTKK